MVHDLNASTMTAPSSRCATLPTSALPRRAGAPRTRVGACPRSHWPRPAAPGIQVLEIALPDSGQGIRGWWNEHGHPGVTTGQPASTSCSSTVRLRRRRPTEHSIALSLDLKKASRAIRQTGRGTAGAAALLRQEMTAFETPACRGPHPRGLAGHGGIGRTHPDDVRPPYAAAGRARPRGQAWTAPARSPSTSTGTTCAMTPASPRCCGSASGRGSTRPRPSCTRWSSRPASARRSRSPRRRSRPRQAMRDIRKAKVEYADRGGAEGPDRRHRRPVRRAGTQSTSSTGSGR